MLFGHALEPILYAAAGLIIVGFGGALLTRLDAWYYALRKPSWQPPDWLFGPAWTIIFLLTGFAYVVSWEQLTTDAEHLRLSGLFTLNLGLNTLWSWLFFTRRRPDLALLDTIPLLASVVLMLVTVMPLDQRAGWALLPYLAWILFAAVLNSAIVRRNPPFGATAPGAA